MIPKRLKITGAQGRIRTSVARKERQIYSLLPLTTRPPVRLVASHESLVASSLRLFMSCARTGLSLATGNLQLNNKPGADDRDRKALNR